MKCNLQILRVNSENLTHMSEALPKRDCTNLHRNMIIAMCTAVCDVNSESKMNVVIRINACKKFFLLDLVLVHSAIVLINFGVSSAILVMVPVEAAFLGELEPITLFRLTLALFLASNHWRKHILKPLA